MFARFWDYLLAVVVYWQFWVAVAFMIERSTERFFPSFWKWSEQYITLEHRRNAFVAIAVVAFVYANFRAFDIAKEQARLATTPPLDPAVLYQGGFAVASFSSPKIDVSNNLVRFGSVTASRELDMSAEFAFREWKLACSGEEGGSMSFGAMLQINYVNFACRIVGPR